MKGKHLLINGFNCNKEKINSRKRIRSFLKRLVEEIDMKFLSQPKVYRAVKGEPDGVTGFVIITTSHISIHTFIDTNHFWMDVFSCKDFDEKKVITLTEREFDCKTNNQVITRPII